MLAADERFMITKRNNRVKINKRSYKVENNVQCSILHYLIQEMTLLPGREAVIFMLSSGVLNYMYI